MSADTGPLFDDRGPDAWLLKELTEGRGADYVVEAVGTPETYQQAFEMVRPGGKVAASIFASELGAALGSLPSVALIPPPRLVTDEPRSAQQLGEARL